MITDLARDYNDLMSAFCYESVDDCFADRACPSDDCYGDHFV